ncbi:hypothetical protein [Rhizobium sp. L43]|uniref:hypothetical protein n=1 Tax=Rhizobium sp. L43 TaxID=2035452 RepID=UPI00117ABE4B|nr:hypothetical protein [Rhizobium sp. L43]
MSRKALFPSGQENRTGGPSTQRISHLHLFGETPYRFVFVQIRRKLPHAFRKENRSRPAGTALSFPALALCPENRTQFRKSRALITRFSARRSGCVETTSNASQRKEHHPNGVGTAREPTFFGVYCSAFDFTQFPGAKPPGHLLKLRLGLGGRALTFSPPVKGA